MDLPLYSRGLYPKQFNKLAKYLALLCVYTYLDGPGQEVFVNGDRISGL